MNSPSVQDTSDPVTRTQTPVSQTTTNHLPISFRQSSNGDNPTDQNAAPIKGSSYESTIAPMQMEEQAPEGAASVGGISRTTGNLRTTKEQLTRQSKRSALIKSTPRQYEFRYHIFADYRERAFHLVRQPTLADIRTFGGHLLLAGVLADRFGKRLVFCSGMIWLTIWSLAVSFAQTEVTLIVFRAFQGLGAAATDQNIAMAAYGGAGSLGSTVGVVFGGVMAKIHGWRKAIVIAPLVVSILTLGSFLVVERRVKNPIMPLQLWKTPGFAGTWFTALFFQAWW
ncbi:hypothetical protein QFC21_000006 [Naganishia friedmannii]|uniref:Uncharacterized protein n=1 Tax=Naganishia friedmannii TaxID=89922 RepID=A0ACC2WCT7_9TREE|nr:hypothetical protein QFC21_000006 [Naganishia friedmannii]